MDLRRHPRPPPHPTGFRIAGRCAAILAALGLMSITSGCDELFDRGGPASSSPDCSGSTPRLNGPWNITGDGRYSGCIDESMNGSFRIETPTPITVSATVDPDDPSLTTFTGTVRGDEPPGFAFTGAATGSCVDFEHTEVVRLSGVSEDRRRMTLTFSGHSDIQRIIEGTFTGTGPGGCSSRGSFRAVVD